MILSDAFFKSATIPLAKNLLGKLLAHRSSDGITIGRIVETEAYLYQKDPACHAHRGMTKRNKTMFGPAGYSYVYFIYGMYHCFNVVSGPEGVGEAVLIRALEPLKGVSLMEKRRKTEKRIQLCNGPGKLMLAMGMGIEHNGLNLRRGPVKILTPDSLEKKVPRFEIVTTTRIGISNGRDLPLRFYIKDCEYISKPSAVLC